MEITRRLFLGSAIALGGNGNPRTVWVDQDGGWEDIAAIAMLLRSPEISVAGITITSGIADSKTARERANWLLEDLHERHIRVEDTIPRDAHILATGPLTRVAALIRAGKAPASITWMGGALGVRGNARGGAEWNAAADVKALATVMQSAIPITICPLDLTNQFPSREIPLAATGTRVVTSIREAYREPGRCCWDELAAGYLAAPGLYKTSREKLRVDGFGRLSAHPSGQEVNVLTACDRDGFHNLLVRSLRF